MIFACEKECGRTFNKSAGLSIHKKSCFIHQGRIRSTLQRYQNAERERKRLVAEKREREAAEKVSQENEAKRRRLDEDLVLSDNNLTPLGAQAVAALPVHQEPQLTRAGRPRRKYRLPARYRDDPPPVPTPVLNPPPAVPSADPPFSDPESNVPNHRPIPTTTKPNAFGIFREYPDRPSYNPDEFTTLSDIADFPTAESLSIPQQSQPNNSLLAKLVTVAKPWFAPFPNPTIARLLGWQFGPDRSSQKSLEEIQHLVDDVLRAPDYQQEHLHNFNAAHEAHRLDNNGAATSSTTASLGGSQSGVTFIGTGWHETSVEICVPDGRKHAAEGDNPKFHISGLYYRNLLDVIKDAVADTSSRLFHWFPFKTFWQHSPTAEKTRIIDEVYSSDAFLEEHEKIQRAPPEPGCNLERVVLGLMFWSDSTHLANFGDASLWPIYIFFANQSKYFRGKPTCGACHHLAYIPKLPETDFQNFFHQHTGLGATKEMLTHCRRELMQAIWSVLFNSDFMEAYEHGIVLCCADGVYRRIFPRIFTYSADYPEKVILASIRSLAQCLCPRCCTSKAQASEMGTKVDAHQRQATARQDDAEYQHKVKTAREFIYQKGISIKSVHVDRVLEANSLTPTRNIFSTRFRPFGFNFFNMLTVDLMHEFELGVWKAIFIHLLRILTAEGGRTIVQLNNRFRHIQTFGGDTIRRFPSNVSAMKQLAARDFEDLLQCAIPVFEGLLPPPHNKIVLDMLYTLAEWHALAKLRMHTEPSLAILDTVTAELGAVVRKFHHTTCQSYVTCELPREVAARGRRKATKDARSALAASQSLAASRSVAPQNDNDVGDSPAAVTDRTKQNQRQTASSVDSNTARRKYLNLNTYKWHSLGDYVAMIRLFGTSDSYSTQPGELEHRRVKRFYGRTNRKGATGQITKLERREEYIKQMQERERKQDSADLTHQPAVPKFVLESLPLTDPEEHYYISKGQKFHFNVAAWLRQAPADDPAVKDFLGCLKDHLLSRCLGRQYDGDEVKFSEAERNTIFIQQHLIYCHKVLRINYTSYDVHRGQDSINPRTDADVMVLAHEELEDNAHPFWYARVLGIYHVNIVHIGPQSLDTRPKRMHFLWVRWFGRDLSGRAGRKARRLHRVGFVPDTDPTAFGFLDPQEVIRGCHLIPASAHGRTSDLLQSSNSLGRPHGETDDYRYYYVNHFVDRDMFMRYLGGGVGHTTMPNMSSAEDSNSNTNDQFEGDGVGDDSSMPQAQNYDDGARKHDGNEDTESEEDNEDNESEEDEPEDDQGEGNSESEENEVDECGKGTPDTHLSTTFKCTDSIHGRLTPFGSLYILDYVQNDRVTRIDDFTGLALSDRLARYEILPIWKDLKPNTKLELYLLHETRTYEIHRHDNNQLVRTISFPRTLTIQ
ncbi:hypothetical protein EW146_g9914 [Bondarzewia mesenterica]|uniref:C2H2-type domain-containing protein n=1 Tax=Bondarzewia mesenterica TaxID=1095465 RepID=A0A4S4L272_9AGAM|nr:hypothetical protein EW146_g9914 [Bondarzewia mesenterica]